jgi:hypothetical protein
MTRRFWWMCFNDLIRRTGMVALLNIERRHNAILRNVLNIESRHENTNQIAAKVPYGDSVRFKYWQGCGRNCKPAKAL